VLVPPAAFDIAANKKNKRTIKVTEEPKEAEEYLGGLMKL
jgi:hypothetical protein